MRMQPGSTGSGPSRRFAGRVGGLVAGSTLVLTASFLGLVALVTSTAGDPVSRLPVYVLVMAGAFVASVVLLEEAKVGGRAVLVTAGGLAVVVFVVAALATEGVLYAVSNPQLALGSQLVVYLLGAALIGTGLGYWGLNHWREVARPVGRL